MSPTLSELIAPERAGLCLGGVWDALRPRAGMDKAHEAVLSWQLALGQAQTLRVSRAGRLQVLQGRAWLTAGAQRWRLDADEARPDDLVLLAGQSLDLPTRSAVVIEAWPMGTGVLRLAWRPA